MLYWSTAGESHGSSLVAFIEGLPAGIALTTENIQHDLSRRRLGYGRGARMSFEKDSVRIISGVRWGKTLGSPIAIEIANSEWAKWEQIMSVDPIAEAEIAHLARAAALTRPRPGHADLVGMLKYGFTDARSVLERASARETAARVAIGVVAKQFLTQLCAIEVYSHVISIGTTPYYRGTPPAYSDLEAIDSSPVRAFSAECAAQMIAEIEAAKKDGDTLGGVFEVLASNVPMGLGSYTSAHRKISTKLAAAMMSINAIKGVEIGDGFLAAQTRGSLAQDEIIGHPGCLTRTSNHCGGIEGGMTNGGLITVRGAMKPISTIPRALKTVDLATGMPAQAIHQRSDICAVPAAAVVGEAMVAIAISEAVLEKFGGDHLGQTRANLESFEREIAARLQHICAQIPQVPQDPREDARGDVREDASEGSGEAESDSPAHTSPVVQ